jgi:hypothetical protein
MLAYGIPRWGRTRTRAPPQGSAISSLNGRSVLSIMALLQSNLGLMISALTFVIGPVRLGYELRGETCAALLQ